MRGAGLGPIIVIVAMTSGGVHAASTGAAAAAPKPASPCVDVRIGDDRSAYLECLNAEMSHTVAQQDDRRAQLQAVVDSSQPQSPTQQALYNQTATRERLGNAFGHSVVPQRPVATYTNPLIH